MFRCPRLGEGLLQVPSPLARVSFYPSGTSQQKLTHPSSNVPISPTETQAIGTGSKPSDTIVPWLPPHACKGEPYHRLSMFILKQSDKIDPAALKNITREGFNTRSFIDKNKVETIGAFMWRAQWDESTKAIMQKHNLPGWETMYIRRRA